MPAGRAACLPRDGRRRVPAHSVADAARGGACQPRRRRSNGGASTTRTRAGLEAGSRRHCRGEAEHPGALVAHPRRHRVSPRIHRVRPARAGVPGARRWRSACFDFGYTLGAAAVGVFASDRPPNGFNAGALDGAALSLYHRFAGMWQRQTGRAPSEEGIAGFSAAWVIFNNVLPHAASLQPKDIAAAARSLDLPGAAAQWRRRAVLV